MTKNQEKIIRQKFGKKVKQIRQDMGLSQFKFAIESELDPAYISRIERGLQNPSLVMLVKIAKASGLDANELFNGII